MVNAIIQSCLSKDPNNYKRLLVDNRYTAPQILVLLCESHDLLVADTTRIFEIGLQKWQINLSKSHIHSTVACTCMGHSMNSGHSPRIKTQFPSQHQQICASYLMVFTPKEIQIFDGDKTLASTIEPILQGWKDLQSRLWCVPILPGQSTEIAHFRKRLKRSTYPAKTKWQTMCTNSQAPSKSYTIIMQLQGSQQRQHG